ncbi:MAG: SpoIVB peptidase [Clostridia bacterium]|nr:SpoIVB peptidase [Clostridia bacterium]
MKKKYFFIILLLTISLLYSCNISQIPDKIILLEGEKINIKKLYGISFETKENESKEVWKNQITENQKINVNLFGSIKVKEVSVTVYPKITVIPTGNLIGLKLYTNGVLIIGMTEIKNEEGIMRKPYETLDIKEGDTILELGGEEIDSSKTLQNIVNNSQGNTLEIKYARNGEIKTGEITPAKVSENDYKLGLWVRDSASGVGTMSFYDPETKKFAALGHGISDTDTAELLNIEKGEMVNSKIINITKGQKGFPGEIKGSISKESSIGQVNQNTNFGIFGNLLSEPKTLDKYSSGIEIALRSEVQTGKATILTTIENNQVEEFEIEITEIYEENNTDNKSIKIRVTDEKLLEKTGGIICGMSGSPIIQNNKLIGVLTNVLVSEPSIGYGVFSDIMIKEMIK